MDELPDASPINLAAMQGDRTVRDWSMAATGDWEMIRNAPSDEDLFDSIREFNRLRDSARQWAYRHRYTCRIRRRGSGRQVWVQLVKET